MCKRYNKSKCKKYLLSNTENYKRSDKQGITLDNHFGSCWWPSVKSDLDLEKFQSPKCFETIEGATADEKLDGVAMPTRQVRKRVERKNRFPRQSLCVWGPSAPCRQLSFGIWQEDQFFFLLVLFVFRL